MKLSHFDYIHPQDAAALKTLEAIPGFKLVVHSFMKIFTEQMLHGMNLAQKVKLGPNQLPEIYNLLPPICELFDIDIPELYLEQNPSPNAYTYGDTKAFITINSALVDCMDKEELRAVIAHECGHIACHHVLYHTMANLLIQFGPAIFGPLEAISAPAQIALLYWYRRSELSADRAAAIYSGGSKEVIEFLMRLAGGPKNLTANVNIPEYMKQADEYHALIEESKWNSVLQSIAIMKSSHPFPSVRAKEISDWCEREQYQNILLKIKENSPCY